jgi:predicted kinase
MTAAPAIPNGISHDGSIASLASHASMASHEVPRYVDNPLPHVLPEGENATPLEVMGSTASDKLVIIMVGLPATGKTHIAKRICRFLSFFHDIPSQIFNVGDYRRQLCGAQLPAQFYSPDNPEGVAARKIACDAALADLVDYISQDGVRVAALDATNSTFERRQHIIKILNEKQGHRGIKKMFVESVCDDEMVSSRSRRRRYVAGGGLNVCSHFYDILLFRFSDSQGEYSKSQTVHS